MRVEHLETAVSLVLLLGPLVLCLWQGRKLLRLLPIPVVLILSKSVWADYGLERSVLALSGVALMWAMAGYVLWDARRRRS